MQQSWVIVKLVMLLLWSIAEAQALPPDGEVAQPVGVVDSDVGMSSLDLSSLSDNPASRSIGDRLPVADWVRLNLVVESKDPLGDLSIMVFDAQDYLIETIHLKGKTRHSFWTKFMTSDEFLVRVEGARQSQGSLKVMAIAKAKREVEPLSLFEPDERRNIEEVTDLPTLNASRGVVKIYYQDAGFTRSCTGFLIGKRRIVTNEHCVNSQEKCDSAVAIVDYLKDGMAVPGQQSKCLTFKDADATLDISVLDFDNAIPDDISPFKLATVSPSNEQPVNIIQFAANEPKKISTRGCSAVKNPEDGYGIGTDFSHRCDTVKGSSGSPVLTSSFEVVGLHHLAINGLPYNRAVRIELIRPWLQLKGLLPL